MVDGDDELLGREAFKVFNAVYQKTNAGVVYSNHLKVYWKREVVYIGWSSDYSDEEKKGNRYREVPQKISHLRSFRRSLFMKIRESDLRDEHGEWFRSTYDEVICLPLL